MCPRRTTKESKWTAPEEWKRAQAGKAAAAAAPGAKPVVQVVKAEAPAAVQVSLQLEAHIPNAPCAEVPLL